MAGAMRGGLTDKIIMHADRSCRCIPAPLARFAQSAI